MIQLAETGWIPDAVCRWGIRRLCRERLASLAPGSSRRVAEQMRRSPLAIAVDEANEQHYELPPQFFRIALGSHLKYSACDWSEGVNSLDEAEASMLQLSSERAQLADGMEILELGCGWGSWSLWMAERYPNSSVTSVSNSASQRDFILARAEERGLGNLTVVTCDMNSFETEQRFDRVVSIEMFEHMRNYETLLGRVASWLKPTGKLFVHIFCHREHAYFFETDGERDWMARYFFTEGLMPSFDLLEKFDDQLELESEWFVDGRHYEKTANAWLRRLDARRGEVQRIFEDAYGKDAAVWIQRWRLFFMACAESFGFNGGSEWHVGHYLFQPKVAE